MEPFLGQIMMFAGNFEPKGWAFCNGQLLSISQYSSLFSILGTTYGVNGINSFALPDLQGRSPIHAGHGAGLSDIKLGQKGGAETHTLTVGQMPNHSHDGSPLNIGCNEEDGDSDEAKGGNFGIANSGTSYNSNANDSTMASKITGNTGAAGGGLAYNTRNPYLGINYIIALEGIFPARN